MEAPSSSLHKFIAVFTIVSTYKGCMIETWEDFKVMGHDLMTSKKPAIIFMDRKRYLMHACIGGVFM